MPLPPTVGINAWTGREAPASPLGAGALRWGLTSRVPSVQTFVLAPEEEQPWNWRHADVGWGLVLPENDLLTAAERATAIDAPPAIQRLLAARAGGPVLRYCADHSDGYLRRYYDDGTHQDPALAGGTRGVGRGALPQYLLLYAEPSVIPWRFQYVANLSAFVGRLTLTGDALERYVDALLTDWADATSDPRRPVVWSANHGHPDITWLMNAAIAKALSDDYDRDTDLAPVRVFDDAATAAALGAALATHRPSVVVTTSHGQTGPLDDATTTRTRLGWLVDSGHTAVDPAALLADWSPNGAVWYAHACCSAGSDAASMFAGLFDEGASVRAVLEGVATACGARVAPLPLALLGADAPLRAFVGHVEPTFDWTLRDPSTGQPLVHTLRRSLYTRLYLQQYRVPVGYALERVFHDAGAFLAQWSAAMQDVNRNVPDARTLALYRQLVALDRMQTVILGDPTVAIPHFAAGGGP